MYLIDLGRAGADMISHSTGESTSSATIRDPKVDLLRHPALNNHK